MHAIARALRRDEEAYQAQTMNPLLAQKLRRRRDLTRGRIVSLFTPALIPRCALAVQHGVGIDWIRQARCPLHRGRHCQRVRRERNHEIQRFKERPGPDVKPPVCHSRFSSRPRSVLEPTLDAVAGHGVRATIGTTEVLVGRRKLMSELGLHVLDWLEQAATTSRSAAVPPCSPGGTAKCEGYSASPTPSKKVRTTWCASSTPWGWRWR
jgi:hypothetical protein